MSINVHPTPGSSGVTLTVRAAARQTILDVAHMAYQYADFVALVRELGQEAKWAEDQMGIPIEREMARARVEVLTEQLLDELYGDDISERRTSGPEVHLQAHEVAALRHDLTYVRAPYVGIGD